MGASTRRAASVTGADSGIGAAITDLWGSRTSARCSCGVRLGRVPEIVASTPIR